MASKTYFAAAKVNLSLLVTGKRSDGYHLLHSLTTFANFGDVITMTPANEFKFTQSSAFKNLPEDDNNLIVRTAHKMAEKFNKPLSCHIHLNKKIPIGAGLGGGSSDVAATVKALIDLWGITPEKEELQNFLLSIGADAPACYYARPCVFEGIGEVITPVSTLPQMHAVLVYPNKFCSTIDVFKKYNGEFSKAPEPPHGVEVWNYLKNNDNDLTQSAIENIPEINDALNVLEKTRDVVLSRMSGSGSCCFGIFETKDQANQAAEKIQKERPNWWVRPVILNHEETA
jgi:4-diphosphocytidyl-2-C-methyl-D-erythritol kinase